MLRPLLLFAVLSYSCLSTLAAAQRSLQQANGPGDTLHELPDNLLSSTPADLQNDPSGRAHLLVSFRLILSMAHFCSDSACQNITHTLLVPVNPIVVWVKEAWSANTVGNGVNDSAGASWQPSGVFWCIRIPTVSHGSLVCLVRKSKEWA